MLRRILFLVFILNSATVFGAEMSLSQCIETALRNNPGLKQASAEWEAADAVALQAHRQRLPQLALTAGYTRLSDVDPFRVDLPLAGASSITIAEPILDNYRASISVTQPLFTGFRLKNRVHLNRQLADARQMMIAGAVNQLIYDVTEAYYRFFLAEQSSAVINESLAALQAHREDVKNRLAVGMVTRNDDLQVEVAVSSLHLELVKAETGIKMARVHLQNLLGWDSNEPIFVSDSLETRQSEYFVTDDLLEPAYENRAELRAWQCRLASAEYGVKIAAGGYLPTLSAHASYNLARPHQRYQPPRDVLNDDWQVGVVAQWTPFDWGETGQKVREAKAAQQNIESQIEQVKLAIRAEITEAVVRLEEAKTRIDLAVTMVEQARENLEVARDQYRNGMSTNTDVLTAETSLLQARLDETAARVDYWLGQANIDRVIGRREYLR